LLPGVKTKAMHRIAIKTCTRLMLLVAMLF